MCCVIRFQTFSTVSRLWASFCTLRKRSSSSLKVTLVASWSLALQLSASCCVSLRTVLMLASSTCSCTHTSYYSTKYMHRVTHLNSHNHSHTYPDVIRTDLTWLIVVAMQMCAEAALPGSSMPNDAESSIHPCAIKKLHARSPHPSVHLYVEVMLLTVILHQVNPSFLGYSLSSCPMPVSDI